MLQKIAHVGGQISEPAHTFEHVSVRIPQDAKSRAFGDRHVLVVAFPDDDVLAIPKEREMVVVEPFEERFGLLDIFGRDRAASLIEFADGVLEATAHRLPVGHRRANVGQDLDDRVLDLIEGLRPALLVDLDMHERLEHRTV